MSHVMRATDVIGLPVVAIDAGEDIAEIRDVIYDADQHRIVGFTLNKRGLFAGRMKDVLPSEAVAAIGADAVMVSDEKAITDSGSPPPLKKPGEAKSVLGNQVLSSTGDHLGTVAGVIIATGPEPAAVGYELDVESSDRDADTVFVPISAQMVVSDENLMLPAEATEFVRNDLAGFGAAVTDYRQSTLQDGNR